MPIGAYFHGHGASVLADLIRRHGAKAGTRMFYATANTRRQTPASMAAVLAGHLTAGRFSRKAKGHARHEH